jgi:hypothetical protein
MQLICCKEHIVESQAEFLRAYYGARRSLTRMQSELKEILGREVDLVEGPAMEKSRNYIRRKAILSSAETVRRDEAYLLDMVLAARDAVSFVRDFSPEQLGASRLHQLAVIKVLETLGEAAARVSEQFAWRIRKSRGMRSSECVIASCMGILR